MTRPRAQPIVDRFRALATPIADLVGPMPYPGIYEFSAEAENPAPAITRSLFADALDDEAIERIVARMNAPDRPEVAITQVRVLGGEMARVAADASAFAHRDATVMLSMYTILIDPDRADADAAWTDAYFADHYLCTFLFGGASVFKRASVQQVGGYDEALCGGLQDIDFSLRVFQLGYKVGSAGTVALSHDPAPGPGAEDADRCSTSDAVIASANRFQDKHGISVAGDILRSLATEGTSDIDPATTRPPGPDPTHCSPPTRSRRLHLSSTRMDGLSPTSHASCSGISRIGFTSRSFPWALLETLSRS